MIKCLINIESIRSFKFDHNKNVRLGGVLDKNTALTFSDEFTVEWNKVNGRFIVSKVYRVGKVDKKTVNEMINAVRKLAKSYNVNLNDLFSKQK